MPNAEGKRVVVIVNDERHIARLLHINFERAGYQVFEAYDGKEGLRLIRKEKPDIAIVDIMMPTMDGFEVLNEMQADEGLKDIPAIMLTAGREQCPHCGFPRPINPREILAYANRILDEAQAPPAV